MRKPRGLGKSPIDLTGNKFGLLTVVKEVGRYRKDFTIRMWMCQCECGNIHTTRHISLTSGRTRSCGCLRTVLNPAFNGLFGNYKGQAKSRGIAWELTQEQFKKLTESPCYYTGREPSSVFTSVGSRERSKRGLPMTECDKHVYNGIDRLDSNKGYTLDNCVSCCKDANLAKQSLSHDEFIALCKEIAARH